MKLLKENLVNYEKSMGLSTADIAEICELSLQTVSGMEEGSYTNKDVFQLCSKLEIDYSSVYSDSGFKSVPVIDQYEEYPAELKRIISKAFYREMMKKLSAKNATSCAPFHHTLSGRLNSGSACFTDGNLENFRESVKDYISKEEFNDLLSSIMYSKIPNYNYNVLKDAFQIQYNDIGNYLGISPSTASNWGGKWCVGIPEERIDEIVDMAGGINKAKFTTTVLTKKDFAGLTCKVTSSKVKKKKVKKLVDFPDPPSYDEGEIEKNEPEPAIDSKEGVPTEPSSGSAILSVAMTDDRAWKLYKALSDEKKQKVISFISDLFFAQ